MKKILAGMVFFLAFAIAGKVQAVPVEFKFTGTVTQSIFDPFDPFGGTIDFGTSISGKYIFDSAAMDQIPSPSSGSYSFTNAPYGMQVDIGGTAFETSEFLNIGVVDSSVDQYTVLAQQGIPNGLDDYLSISFLLQDNSGTAFDNDALPLVAPDLNDFTFSEFFLDGVRTIDNTLYQFQIQGFMDSVTVPEPASLFLIGLGLAVMCFNGYKWRSKSRCLA